MKKPLLITSIIFVLIAFFLLGGKYLKRENKEGLALQFQANQSALNQSSSNIFLTKEFNSEKGQELLLEGGEVKIDASVFDENQAHFYNVKMPDNKIIYFFVVKDKNGIYRAAANACQVCFSVRKGFHQEGDEIVCDNCGNRYPVEKIATEKGGCNPGPINPNLEVKNGKLTIKQTELEQVSEFF